MQYHKLLSVVFLVIMSGCGGRNADPVKLAQPGDSELSCFALDSELKDVEECMKELVPSTSKAGKNVGLGVAGWFLIVPWVFMDFSRAEQQELEAYRKRYNHLVRLYNNKRCYAHKPRPEIPPFNKTVEG